MAARGVVTIEGKHAEVLSTRVVADHVELTYDERKARANPLTFGDKGDDDDAFPRRRFFYDFEKYWCYSLAEAFSSKENDISRRAIEVATDLDGYEMFAARTDPRTNAGIYDRRGQHMGHADWQGEDNLSFYLAIHSLLTVGAELAEAHVAYKDPESTRDSYMYWLSSYLPQRPNGRWLADRRDPPPDPSPDQALISWDSDETWPWSLTKHDFEKVANLAGDAVTVWANFESARENRSEEVLIQSALVPRETAQSLLIALQTSPSGPYSYTMPAADGEADDPEELPYELVPWLHVGDGHWGIDEHDERGGHIRVPPARPGASVIASFGLTSDEDERAWFYEGQQVFWGRLWGNMTPTYGDREQGTSGEKLEVDLSFLMTVLQRLDMTLALHVGMCRRTHRPSYQRRGKQDDEFEWLERSGKVYLLDPGGHWLEY